MAFRVFYCYEKYLGRNLQEKYTQTTRKCHRQVVDLVTLCLVFGLPLTTKNL